MLSVYDCEYAYSSSQLIALCVRFVLSFGNLILYDLLASITKY